jgi:hypothetical protein
MELYPMKAISSPTLSEADESYEMDLDSYIAFNMSFPTLLPSPNPNSETMTSSAASSTFSSTRNPFISISTSPSTLSSSPNLINSTPSLQDFEIPMLEPDEEKMSQMTMLRREAENTTRSATTKVKRSNASELVPVACLLIERYMLNSPDQMLRSTDDSRQRNVPNRDSEGLEPQSTHSYFDQLYERFFRDQAESTISSATYSVDYRKDNPSKYLDLYHIFRFILQYTMNVRIIYFQKDKKKSKKHFSTRTCWFYDPEVVSREKVHKIFGLRKDLYETRKGILLQTLN